MILDRRRWGGALLVCFATALVALETPVRLSEGGARTDPADILPEEVVEVAPEDLGAFLASRRWGASLNELREASVAPAEPPNQDERAINPALAEMGYVGLIVAKDQNAVLLASPEGGIVRMAPGDRLPDGRTLVSVTDNSLTLKGDGLPEEVLTLFPPIQRVGFDVSIEENELSYVKDPCAPTDTKASFFLHVTPLDTNDLPEHRKQYGFDNLDFGFDSRGVILDGQCRVTVNLPEYAITRIRTGQFISGQGRIWREEIPFGK